LLIFRKKILYKLPHIPHIPHLHSLCPIHTADATRLSSVELSTIESRRRCALGYAQLLSLSTFPTHVLTVVDDDVIDDDDDVKRNDDVIDHTRDRSRDHGRRQRRCRSFRRLHLLRSVLDHDCSIVSISLQYSVAKPVCIQAGR